MPTAKPRITITLSEKAHYVLSTLSQVQKVSMSSIVVDLLDTTLPVLEKLADVLNNAALAPQSVLDDLRRTMEEAHGDLESAKSGVLEHLENIREVSGGAPAGDALASPAGVPPAPKPPTSNRGVRITSPRVKIDTIPPMKRREKNGRAEK